MYLFRSSLKNGAVRAVLKRQIVYALTQRHGYRSTHNDAAASCSSFRFVAGSANLVPPGKSNPLGEDAHFVSANTIGVADGVGSWVRYGVDPGVFSRELMDHIRKLSEDTSSSKLTPKEVLEDAYSEMKKDFDKIQGSCTACLVKVCGNEMITANLGDSGFMILRRDQSGKWTQIFKSAEQTHFFNCPFQLGSTGSDEPTLAEEKRFEIQEGDLIILATDGLFDNLHPEEIVDTVSKHTHIILEEGPKVKTDPRAHNSFAYAIADAAQLASTSVTTVTPFTMSALKAGYKHLGGKVDDITIVTAIVVKDK